MKLKDGFVVRKIGDDSFAVAVGERSLSFNGMVRLNSSGEALWNMLAEGAEMEELLEKSYSLYPETDKEIVKADIETFIKDLDEAGLLDG